MKRYRKTRTSPSPGLVVTYGQLLKVVAQLVGSGARGHDEPVKMNGRYWASIVDGQNGNAVLAAGSVEQPPLDDSAVDLPLL